MGPPSLDHDYFARVYAETSDPWNFADSPYENAKYRATIAALGSARFAAGFEIGCSVGVLTAQLATRCDALLSIDINERALTAARERCAPLDNVRFAQMTFPRERPEGHFDLIVFSEVAYYWSDDDLAAAIEYAATAGRGGTIELVHFLPKVADYIRDGDAVHRAFLADARLRLVHAERSERYRIDVLRA
jgi:SAM-dependent methyltransferase